MSDRSDFLAGDPPALEECSVRMVDPQRVAAASAAMPEEETVEELSVVFGLLADRGRLRLMTALLEAGEMCVCDLAATTGQTEPAVSHALRLLRAHQVVRVRRSGRMAYYRPADSHVRILLGLALTHIAHGGDASRTTQSGRITGMQPKGALDET
jgi:DNA-binding transcriptional ArsR family regulator